MKALPQYCFAIAIGVIITARLEATSADGKVEINAENRSADILRFS